MEDEEEKVLDMAEGSLFALIQNGDFGAICYFLNNKGKKRGYAHPRELQQNDERKKSDNRTGVLIASGLVDDKTWEEAASAEKQGAGDGDGAGQG